MLIGASLQSRLATSSPLVAVAMVNDRHFWGTQIERVTVIPDSAVEWIVPALAPASPTSSMVGSLARDLDRGDDDDGDDDPHVASNIISFLPDRLPGLVVETEFALCEGLVSWNPWTTLDPDSAPKVFAALRGLSGTNPATAQRCLVRAQVIQDMAYEQEHHDALPATLLTNRSSRTPYWRLRKQQVPLSRGAVTLAHLDQQKYFDLGEIRAALVLPCEKHGSAHSCLNLFREHPESVRNWRMLWYSLPRAERKTSLARMYNAASSYKRGKASSPLPTNIKLWG